MSVGRNPNDRRSFYRLYDSRKAALEAAGLSE